MVDAHDLFKKLGCGAKFDFKRFKDDVGKFKISFVNKKAHDDDNGDDVSEALDFFGTKSKKLKADKLDVKTKTTTEGEPKIKKKKRKRKADTEAEKDTEGSGYIDLLRSSKEKRRNVKNKTKILSKEQLTERHLEKISLFRKENRIHVYGTDVPDPVETFVDLQRRFSLSKKVVENINNSGYTIPTSIQMQAITMMLQRRELLACAPTGSGKTLAFIIPLLSHLKETKKSGFRAVVISPTRELAQQIHHEFVRMNVGIGLRIHVLTKSKASSNNFCPKTGNNLDILISTPNRLVHMLQQDPPAIDLSKVEWLVMDEGDKLFEEGAAGFRDQVAMIYKACDNPLIKRALFSATLANNVEEWSKTHLDNVLRITVGTRNSATETVDQKLMFVGQESGKLLAVRQIIQNGFKPPLLVFVQSRDRAKDLFNELIYDGLHVDVIHSDRTQVQRENVVKSFRTGKIWILIATELMGRGIDFKGVNMVINYDFPPTAVSYIHRIGRTGRAGREGKAVTLFTEDDIVNLRSIANVMKSSGCNIPDWMLQIKKADRRTQKKLTKVPLQRDHIKTVSKYDVEQSKKKKQMIEMSKTKKTDGAVDST